MVQSMQRKQINIGLYTGKDGFMYRAKCKKVFENVWLIDDAGESTCYVVMGKEKGMVIDTANGAENLQEVIRTLTDLPLVVANTHGHGDHIQGNYFFDEMWIHPADEALAQDHYGWMREEMEKAGLKPGQFRFLAIGQKFDLGGTVLEVVDLKGHTAGSVGFLDRNNRVLFSGDGVIPTPWMQLDHSLPIATLRDTLINLKANYGGDFDYVLFGHAQGLVGTELVDQLLNGCKELLAGQRDRDTAYQYFDGECLFHPCDEEGKVGIVYTEDKL
mgnify:CR=1 FL=1